MSACRGRGIPLAAGNVTVVDQKLGPFSIQSSFRSHCVERLRKLDVYKWLKFLAFDSFMGLCALGRRTAKSKPKIVRNVPNFATFVPLKLFHSRKAFNMCHHVRPIPHHGNEVPAVYDGSKPFRTFYCKRPASLITCAMRVLRFPKSPRTVWSGV